eukprot:1381690-Rhodomonas_salina.2
MSGTELAYATIRRAMRCPVLTSRMLLPGELDRAAESARERARVRTTGLGSTDLMYGGMLGGTVWCYGMRCVVPIKCMAVCCTVSASSLSSTDWLVQRLHDGTPGTNPVAYGGIKPYQYLVQSCVYIPPYIPDIHSAVPGTERARGRQHEKTEQALQIELAVTKNQTQSKAARIEAVLQITKEQLRNATECLQISEVCTGFCAWYWAVSSTERAYAATRKLQRGLPDSRLR